MATRRTARRTTRSATPAEPEAADTPEVPTARPAATPVTLKLTGRAIASREPTWHKSATRGSSDQPDPFFPPGYLTPVLNVDVGIARGSEHGATEQTHRPDDDEVIVLELTDGSVFVTSARRLRASLAQTHPELLGQGGEILLEKLQQEAVTSRGWGSDIVGGLISKVFSFVVGRNDKDDIIDAAVKALGGRAKGLGVSWAGTKALMFAIESRLPQKPGLYRWGGASALEPVDLRKNKTPQRGADNKPPMLVFVHGTASSTLGSFGELREGDRALWAALENTYTGGIFALEHPTLSKSPIENAIDLVTALPDGARVSVVSHSRGGLVADLLCLRGFEGEIDRYRNLLPGIGEAPEEQDDRVDVRKELDSAHAEHRADLATLAKLLAERQIVVERYVRTASPANGTRLASGNFDLFLSGILTLIGQVPVFFGSPLYSAFKRVVIEIAKNRTNPHLVPGIEAMLPDSPMARLLRDAPVQPGIRMAVIAGDIEGGNLLKRLGVLLTDFLLFDRYDNDLVVDTSAMLAGVAHRAKARVLFDRGADVSHFRYFKNLDTRTALRDWLVAPEPKLDELDAFRELPDPTRLDAELAEALKSAASRDATAAERPVVVLLPGVMGSHLAVNAKRRVWFDPLAIAAGRIKDIGWDKEGVEAEDVFGMFYGQACEHLIRSHHVECFAYDWRQPLDVLGERFGAYLERLMAQTKQPIRLLAHSMGGLVVRACIHRRRAVMDRLMARDGARLVMLGTPNQGAHSMVENLLGKGDTLRMLVRLDLRHDMQEILDIVAGFRGALQLLPKPGFIDDFQGPEGGTAHAYQERQTWAAFKGQVRDLWFGNGKSAVPDQAVLDAGSWLWAQDGKERPRLPDDYAPKSIYVFGVARQTPCGLRNQGGRLKMVATPRGDGTVSWESGRIGGVGSHFYMTAEHGDLLATPQHFDAIVELLSTGATARLPMSPPAVRAIEHAVPVIYDAGPPVVGDIDATARAVMGASLRRRVEPRAKRRLEVSVKAMDLRFLSQPVLVGHYEQDPIAGPQSLIDSELLDGDLTERHNLGLYAGPVGTAVVVLRMPNEAERRRGSLSGAVVTGLGPYDGALGMDQLTEAVRTGVLRYLLQVVDVLGKADRAVPLATLLMGYNSSANLTVAASVEALVCGVYQANARFKEATRLNIHVGRLSIVELYLDTAITAVYCLRQMAERLGNLAEKQDTQLVCRGELDQGEGFRPRLLDTRGGSYWPRLIVTNPDDDATLRPADGGVAGGAAMPAGAATALANRIRFLYVGQRARAESIVQQRQPGLVESLVRHQIANPQWQEDFGRTLFQLMVPHDFKDAARQLSRIVLVVDRTTADLPWELMLADDPQRKDDDLRPLSLRTPVVRQLASKAFRRQVRQSVDRTALVVGNPALTGFDRAFPRADGTPSAMPPDLPGAEAEAQAVTGILSGMGYDVTSVIGNDQPANNVLAALYRRPWRVLHVSAHGVFNLKHADGLHRSGVLLSDGLLLTAAEIGAMESVPELVFLSCCHLGKVDRPDPGQAERLAEANKLAASVARELIEIGVRCVVVAGWAVSDDLARLFGETFYEELLRRRQSFGDAVFRARRAVWEKSRADITWGAYQAYGDPGWKAEPRSTDGDGRDDDEFVSLEELLDRLASARADFSRQSDRLTAREKADRVKAIDQMIRKRCPPGWRAMPLLQSALAATWRDLGEFEQARTAYIAAIQAEDKFGRVPIRDIEQLANVEARLGEQQATALVEARLKAMASGAWGPPQASADAKAKRKAMALIKLALRRIEGLDDLVSAQTRAAGAGSDAPAETPYQAERCAIKGSAWKRMATLHAQDALTQPEGDPAAVEKAAREMKAALDESIAAYRQGEGPAGSSRFLPYPALNRLALEALVLGPKAPERDVDIALARQCGAEAAQRFESMPTVWDALMQPEALLVEMLLDERLGEAGDAGRQTFEALESAYVEALRSITLRPSQLDSVLTHMELLSRFLDAISLVSLAPAKARRAAARLLALVRRLAPARPLRTDRPPSP